MLDGHAVGGFRAIGILRMLHRSLGADILHHATPQCHSECLDTTTDAKYRNLTVIGQTRDQQFWQVALLIDAMQQRRRLLTSPKGIEVSATTENQGIDTIEGIQDGIGICDWGDNQWHTSGSKNRLIIAFPEFTGQVVVVASDAYNGLAASLWILRIDSVQSGLQVKMTVHFLSSWSNVIGISRFRLCSSEIRVSVATTPCMPCSLPLSRSISCSLSLAYNFTSIV